jgi:hypothetical protein
MSLGLSLGLSLRSSGLAGFSPLSLFASGEAGYWLDPSDFSTMFQDDAGVTPVTAVGQSVRRILDKSRGGPGPELVTLSALSGTADWAFSGGAWVLTNASNNNQRLEFANLVVGRTYRISVTVTAISTGSLTFRHPTITTLISGAPTISAPGTYTVEFIATGVSVFVRNSVAGQDATVSAVSIREIPGIRFIQSNVANAPLLQVDSNGNHFLLFDGSDDFLQSDANIDPGAVDKVQVFAGVRKLSDAAQGMLLEVSTVANITPGSLRLRAPILTQPGYGFSSNGTVEETALVASGFLAPITNVLTGLGDISSPSAILRVNGTQVASSTATQGTGDYLTYQHFIGRRGGVSNPFNGRIYQLITRYGPNLSADQIAAAETFVNQRTGAF